MAKKETTSPAVKTSGSAGSETLPVKSRLSRSKAAIAARAADKAALAIATTLNPTAATKEKPTRAIPPSIPKQGSPDPMPSRSSAAVKSETTPAPVTVQPNAAAQPDIQSNQTETVDRSAIPPPGPRPILPQRAIAKAENFKEGDFVVYPTHGVGKVERVSPEEIAGHKLDLIHITFDENRMTLRVPVNKARTAGLRKLSSRKQFDEVLVTLKGRARIKRTMWSRRAQEYEAKINSGDPMAIAEVVRDLHRNAGQPDQSFSERQIFEAALERLAAEYAALESLTKLEAIDKLLIFLKTE